MKYQAILFLTVGLLVGIGGTSFVMKDRRIADTTATTAMSSMDSMAGMDTSASPASGASMSTTEMTSELSGVTGDEFDKKFVSEMIAHHQGAIDMATLASGQAKHQEVKDLARGIISAQTAEIAQMQSWQKSWGYSQ